MLEVFNDLNQAAYIKKIRELTRIELRVHSITFRTN